jgi:hypothetical protein
MGVRNGTSINAFIPYDRIAPGAMVFLMEYMDIGPDGRPIPAIPDSIQLIVTRPDGISLESRYPAEGGYGEIERVVDGRYRAVVALDREGMHRYRIITNSGYGPSEDGQFQVAPVS